MVSLYFPFCPCIFLYFLVKWSIIKVGQELK